MGYKRLGALNPAATTYVSVYTVPASGECIVATILVTNQSDTPTTFRLGHMVNSNGTVTSPTDADLAIAYDRPIGPRGYFSFTAGVSMGDLDDIVFYAGHADLAVVAWGLENP